MNPLDQKASAWLLRALRAPLAFGLELTRYWRAWTRAPGLWALVALAFGLAAAVGAWDGVREDRVRAAAWLAALTGAAALLLWMRTREMARVS